MPVSPEVVAGLQRKIDYSIAQERPSPEIAKTIEVLIDYCQRFGTDDGVQAIVDQL